MPSTKINQNLRKALIKKVDGICALCLERRYDLDAHRIIPGREGGKYSEENIIMLCPECHRIIDKQLGLRRFLKDLRDALEWILSQHRLPGKRTYIKEIRDQWECRRIKSSKDPLFNDTLKLFKEFRNDENEDLKSIGVWLDEMITWRRICSGLLNNCLDDTKTLNYIFNRLNNIMDFNIDDPRYLELNSELKKLRNKKQLHIFIKNEILKIEDYLIVQRNENRVIGFIYYHYYYKFKYAFVSYIVLAKSSIKNKPFKARSLDRLVYNGLLRNLMKNHIECEGILVEVDPEDSYIIKKAEQKITDKIIHERGKGLYRLFHQQYPKLKRININYMQPKSFIHTERFEKKLWLLYYPLRNNSNYINRKTLNNILEFIYNYVYGDELDNLKEFNSDIYNDYKKYLNKLKDKIIVESPNSVLLI